MDDFMMYKYLKGQGMLDDVMRFRRHNDYNRNYEYSNYDDRNDYRRYNTMYDRDSMYDRTNMMRGYRHNNAGYIDEHTAKQLVSDMYHMENGRKHVGEKYSMHKAMEVMNKYRSSIPHNITECDIYVALNAQYHDYAELFKMWFGDNIDQKIIDSAVTFWFKDADAMSENKVAKYFDIY